MAERIRKSGHWLLCAVLVLGAAMFGLSGSYAQNEPVAQSLPSVLASVLKPLPAPSVLLPDDRTLTLEPSALVLTTPAVALGGKAVTHSVLLPQTRYFATLTVMPDGRVLIWGGVDGKGQIVANGLWFDTASGEVTSASEVPLMARAGGTTTVLSDGRLLVTGGWSPQLGMMPEAVIWNPRSGASGVVSSLLQPPRVGQTAILLPDGRVQLTGGFDGNGQPVTTTSVFDPTAGTFQSVAAKTLVTPVNWTTIPMVMASLPVANATDFPANGMLSVRFSEPMDPATINGKTITLLGPGGDTPVNVVGVEGGRLAFITPTTDLYPSAHYTLFVQDVMTQQHIALPFMAIDFAVAAEGTAGAATGAGADSASSAGAAGASGSTSSAATPASGSSLPPLYVQTGTNTAINGTNSTNAQPQGPCGISGHPVNVLCRTTSFMDTTNDAWYPGQDVAGNPHGGNWRVNQPDISPQQIAYAELMLRVPEGYSGTTGLSGRIELIDGKPIGNVDVSIGTTHVRTDSNGQFKLTGVPAGHQDVYVDGTTADSPGHQYGQFVVGVNLRQGVILPLPYRMYLPHILPQDIVNIPSPTTRDLVITQPDIPGLEVHIPAGTVVKDHNGNIVTQLAIVPTPVDRAPFPTANNFPVFFSIQPSGATVTNVNPNGVQGISLVYPNYPHNAPGTRTDFIVYHPDSGWKVYGYGTVTADGRQVVPVTGGRMVWLYSGMYQVQTTRQGDTPQGKENGPCCGDPVDLYSDTLEESHTDIMIPDVFPLTLTRYYHSQSQSSQTAGMPTMFGDWRSNYDITLYSGNTQPNPSSVSLVLPDGNALPFAQIKTLPGEYDTYQLPPSPTKWSGGLLEAIKGSNPSLCEGASEDEECVILTLKDGTQYIFSDGDDGNNDLEFIRDRFGNQLALTWNGGLLQQVTSPSGRFISFTYSDNVIATATDNTGRVWTYDYTPEMLTAGSTTTTNYFLNEVVYPDSTSWQYGYDTSQTDGGWGNLLTMIDRNGNTAITNTYNGAQVATQKLADGGTFTFTPGSNSMTVTDPDGDVTLTDFDPTSGYPSSVTRGYGSSIAETTTYTRASTGLITSVTDALGRTTSYTYDSKGDVLSLTITGMQGTPSSVTKHFTWTADFNQIATYQDGLGHTTAFTYTNGCLTQIKDPLGHATNIVCSVTGQPLTITDALGHTTTFGYQAYDLRTVTDALNRTTTYTTDSLGRLVAVQDPAGDVSIRTYDPNNDWVDSLIDPMGHTSAIVHDGMGDVKQVTLPNGGSIGYTYDTSERLITRTDALHQSESWTYWPLGEVKTHTDRKGQTTSYTYDALDRLSETTYADDTNVIATYDAGNRLAELNDSADGLIEFGWNGLNELAEEQTEPLGATQFQTVQYQYDAAGRRLSMLAGSQAQVNYTYDNADRLEKLAQGSASVTPVFDNANRLEKLTLPNGVAESYSYDNANEVTGISYADGSTTLGNLAYTYDAAGRRNAQTGTFASDTLPTATTANGTFDLNNRQTGSNGTALQYDADGNLTFDGTNTYVWNARNQLVQIKQGTSVVASFTYDPLGRRQSKTLDGVTTSFLYDGLNPVQETEGSTVSGILEGLGVDQYFARQEPANGNAEEYFLTDAQGSTIGLTDSSGALVQQYHYGPYGEANSNNPGISNPYQYTGRENDGDGLYYYRARYYSPMMKRFVSEDPIAFAGGQNNFYAYVGGSPISYRDPQGRLLATAIIGAITGGIAGYEAGGWRGAIAGTVVGGAVGFFAPMASEAAGAWAGGGIAGAFAAAGATAVAGAAGGAAGDLGYNQLYNLTRSPCENQRAWDQGIGYAAALGGMAPLMSGEALAVGGEAAYTGTLSTGALDAFSAATGGMTDIGEAMDPDSMHGFGSPSGNNNCGCER